MSIQTKSKANKLSLNDIYGKWQSANRDSHALFITYTGIFVSLVMIFADYLFVSDHVLLFTKARVVGLTFLLLNLLCIRFVIPHLQKQNFIRLVSYLQTIALVSAIYIYQLEYLYFNYVIPHDKFSVYFTGLLLGISFSAFMLHRFWVEQLFFHAFFIILTLGILPFAKQEFRESLYIVIIVHLVAGFVAGYFRKDFLRNLNARFNLVSAFIPKQVASHIVVSDSSESVEEIFKARNRYTVCLSCDWREYQKLIASHSPDFISSLTEEYYNRIFEVLERVDPHGQYYANWTADELFVIFFDLNDKVEGVDQRALEFAKELATKIFLEVRYDFSVDLKYDIGLASGNGFLGLQGPAKLKKTTITGFAAGTAKRLETEAKTLRRSKPDDNPNPILLIDSHLYEVSQKMPSFHNLPFTQVLGSIKDIEGKTFFKFQSDLLDIKEITKQKAG